MFLSNMTDKRPLQYIKRRIVFTSLQNGYLATYVVAIVNTHI
jgi:hypothetical protein